jgi:predicted ArsR family transcriptional regulator
MPAPPQTRASWRSFAPDTVATSTGRRCEVLEVLRESPAPLSIQAVAAVLEVHPNTVRFHLERLVDAGHVERVVAAPSGPGRPPLLFRARRGMDPAGPRSYRLLAAMLADGLASSPDPAARAVRLGRRWGRGAVEQPASTEPVGADRAVERLTGLLDDLGFSPERRSAGGGTQVGLRHCPFLELVDTQAPVICALHLGLMQGAMEQIDSAVVVESLEPFAEPDLCLAHVRLPPGSASSGES